MPNILSNGYIKPTNPDTGDTFWGNLDTDIQLMNDHVHDGTTGMLLPTITQALSAGSWVAVVGQSGTFRQLVTMPGSLTYGAVAITAQLANGSKVYPTIEQVTSNTYYVYTCDNTQAYTMVYSS